MALLESAREAVLTCMGVTRGEEVLILVDTGTRRIAPALREAVEYARGIPVIIEMPVAKGPNIEPPALVREAMLHCDVLFAATTYSITHTVARRRATRKGVRVASMPGITPALMSRGGMSADFRKMAKEIKRVAKKLRTDATATLSTDAGTEITFSLKGRRWITEDTGICHRRGEFTNLPAGEIFIAPVEDATEGRIVVDGAFITRVKQPFHVVVEGGYAVSFDPEPPELEQLDAVGRLGRRVAELGFGMNPAAKIIGNPLEDEKALGTAHVAFGDNSTFGGETRCGVHIDAILRKPTLKVGQTVILDEGELAI